MRPRTRLGAYGEQVAAAHLRGRRAWRSWTATGAARRARSTSWPGTATCLVVCEVKTRRSPRFGHPLEAVTPRKAARLRRLAAAWLQDRRVHPAEIRIDVVGVLRPARGAGRGRAPAGGGLSGAGPDPRGRPGRRRGHLVEVEADLGVGVPSFSLVGLPDASLAESRDRVRAAVVNSGQHWPATKRITVNLSPASLPKRGSSFDLAHRRGDARAQEVVPAQRVRRRGAARRAGSGRPGPAGAGRAARGRWRRRGPASTARWCRRRTRPRRGWCRACGSRACAPWPAGGAGCAATSCRRPSWSTSRRRSAPTTRTTRRTGRTSPTSLGPGHRPLRCSRWPRPAGTTC